MNQAFSILYWHEYEFNRNKQYALQNGNSVTGHNGSIGLNWKIIKDWEIGVAYRFVKNKTGATGFADSTIISVKYNIF